MNESLKERVRRFLQVRRHRKTWEKVVGSLAVVVIFITSYMLILPAITMEKPTYCGNTHHTHTASCYEPSEEILDEDNVSGSTGSSTSASTPAHTWANSLSIEGIEEVRTGGEDEGLAEAESESESESESETESESESETESETSETVTAESETDESEKAVAEAQTEEVTEAETELQSEAATKIERASNLTAETETEAQTEAESENAAESEATTETAVELESEETETELQAEISTLEADGIAVLESNAANLYDYIDTIKIEKNNNGTWESVDHKEITEGAEIRFTMEYSVPDGLPDDVTKMQYQLPKNFKFDEEMSGNVTQMQGDTLVNVGTYVITKEGLIEIQLDPDKFQHNESFGGNLQFTCKAQRTGKDDSEIITFPGDKAEVIIKKNTSANDFTMEKKSSWDKDAKKIKYTLTASTQKGTGDDKVVIYDFFRDCNGNKATASYDHDSFKIYKVSLDGTRTEMTGYAPKFGENNGKENFMIEGLPALAGGESYVVEYTASVTDLPTGGGQIKNEAYWKAKWTESSRGSSITKISNRMISKNGWQENGYIKWYIEVNPDCAEDLEGWKLTDSIDINEIEGKITVSPAINGRTEYEPNELNSIVFPKGKTKYAISYKTKAPDVTDTAVTVRNTATIEKDGSSYSDSKDITFSPRSDGIAKSFNSESADEDGNAIYKWNSDLTIPAGAQTEILYRDEILPTADVEHNWQKVTNADGTNPHYAIASELSTEIRKNENFTLTLENDTVLNYTDAINQGYSVEMSFWDENGNPVAETDAVTHVAKFHVKVKKQDGTSILAKRMQMSYLTHADYSEMASGNKWAFQNKGFYGKHEAEANHQHRKEGRAFFKQIGVKQWGNITYYDEDKTISYDSTDGYLYFRLVLKTDVGSNDELVVTDTLKDSGMEFKTDADGNPEVEVRFDDPYNAQSLVESKDWWWESKLNYYYSLKGHNKPEISLNGQTITVKIKAGDGKDHNGKYNLYNTPTSARIFYISYAVKIKDDPYWSDLSKTEKIYGNSAEWDGQKTERKTTVNGRNVESLEKTGVQRTTLEADGSAIYQDMIDYSIVVNPKAENLNPSADTVTLTDQLNCGDGVKAYLDLDSVKVYEYDQTAKDHKGKLLDRSEYTVSYDGQANKPKMTVVLADEKAYVVSYTYVFDKGNKDQPTISNNANLEGKKSSSSNLQLKKNTHSASVYNSNLTVYKVNSSDYSVRLGNAGFTLEKYDESQNQFEAVSISTMSGGGTVQTDEDGGTTYITNADGYLKFSGELKGGKGDTLKKDVIYKMAEVQAPDGYILNTTPYYFVIMSDKTKEAEWRNKIAGIVGGDANIHCFNAESPVALYVPNDFDGITVRKVWQWNDGTTITDASSMPEITVQLYRQVEGGQKEKYGEPQKLNAQNNWTYTWSGMEKAESGTNKIYSYTVEEIVPDKFELVSITNNGVQVGGKEIVITNKQLVVLPDTGGSGTLPYIAGGLAVMTAGLLYGYSLRRRRERRLG